ncbi:MAG: hypothetical protein SGJ07_03580 [Rhodospirillaceae bacterium]|nr:hypothetical protein [Rhodospirillaceae bacterium]
MDNWITSTLALIALGAFLIALAAAINSIPFFVVVVIVLLCAALDFIQSSRENDTRPRP